MKRLTMAIDGNNLSRRMYHIGESNADETRLLHAVYEFFSYLLRLDRDYSPAKVLIAWDEPPYFRSGMYAPYKANRPLPEGNWETQLHFIKETAEHAGSAQVSQRTLEADDLLAVIARTNSNVIVITSDKDLLALVGRSTTVELLRWTRELGTHRKRLTSADDVKEFFGVLPHQVSTYKALAGDSSDNVPGVKGVGKKNAIALIESYETLDGIYAHLGDLRTKTGKPSAVARALLKHRDNAYLFRALCELKGDAQVVMPEAKPLSTSAISDALKRLPNQGDI